MAKRWVIGLVVLAVSCLAISAFAAEMTVEGTVSGYTCVVLGKACPVDMEDPIIATERVFVVVKPDGAYYLVPNLDRAILARHITEKVRVTGMMDEKYKSIMATKFEVKGMSGWKTAWSPAMEEDARKILMYQ